MSRLPAAPDYESLHAGLAPTRGEKWLFSQWIRSKPVNAFATPGRLPSELDPAGAKTSPSANEIVRAFRAGHFPPPAQLTVAAPPKEEP